MHTLWVSRSAPEHHWEHLMPTGRAQLLVPVHDGATQPPFVQGGRSRAVTISTSSQAHLYGVDFAFGGPVVAFGPQAAPIVDSLVPLESFWGAAAQTLRRDLRNAADPTEGLAHLEVSLAARLPPTDTEQTAFALACEQLLRGHRVGRVAASVGLSGRRLIELVRSKTGFTPKKLARLGRFQRLVGQIDSHPDWTSLAYVHGYADQAHMIREFRTFTGMTPTAYWRARGGSANHVPVAEETFNTPPRTGPYGEVQEAP